MSQAICVSCQKTSESDLISLVCDHILCINCADNLKTVQGHSTIQNKYCISCPACKKGTVTYDIKNLLLKTTAENLIFQNFQNSELNESSLAEDRQRPNSQHQNFKQMSYSQRVNNLSRKQSKTPDVYFDWKDNRKSNYQSGRASRNEHRQEEYSSICKQHSETLIFFCEQQRKLLCMECMYKHTKEHKTHKVLSIKNSINIISKQNSAFKDETKRKMQELEQYIRITHQNKTILEEKFRSSLETIANEFSAIQLMLKTRQAMLRDGLKSLYSQRDKQLNTQIGDLTHLQNCLKQYMSFELKGTSAQIYFFHAYSLLRQAMSKLNLKVHPITPSSINLIEKNDHSEIKAAVDRLFQVPRERRVESRLDSAHPKRSVLNEQIKNAKKKLQKLQKLEKSDKGSHYLNNYISNLSRQKQYQRERKSVQVENQRKLYNKVITPTRISSKIKHKK